MLVVVDCIAVSARAHLILEHLLVNAEVRIAVEVVILAGHLLVADTRVGCAVLLCTFSYKRQKEIESVHASRTCALRARILGRCLLNIGRHRDHCLSSSRWRNHSRGTEL